MMTKKILFFLLILVSFSNCKKDVDWHTINIQEIKDYLAENNIDATETESGLFYIIEEEGVGEDYPTQSSTVRINYTGYLTCHLLFDKSSSVEPFETKLTNVVAGWQEGIPYFKKGAKGKLFIPSKLGYGSSGQGPIGSNTVLIFDIELVSFF